MKGVVKFDLGVDSVQLMDVPEPSPGKGELKVKVLAAGICGSDIHALHDKRSVIMPVVLGHEFVGQVVETGGNTGEFDVGDWIVTLPACYSCGECELCKRGLVTLCKERKSIGSHRNGAMANYVIVPAKYSYKLPDSADTIEKKKIYALAEPMTCVVRGVYERINVNPGDVAVISGPGPMGLLATQLFKERGAYVIVSGLPQDKTRLEMALRLGADEAVSSFDDLKEAVYRKNPDGADITCDTTGVAPGLANCLEVVKVHGVHLQVGMFGRSIEVRMDRFFEKEVNYVATNSTATTSWKIGMALLESGRIDLAPIADLELPLERWREGFDAVVNKTSLKVLLIPDNTF